MRTPAPLPTLALLLCLSAFILLSAQPGYAQSMDAMAAPLSSLEEVAFEHITVVEGLPENSVWAVLQDHLGFLWFGTQNGLVKYDGYTYTLFKPDPEDPHSLSDARIYALYEDTAGNLWVGTAQGGLNHFDRTTEQFTAYQHNPGDPSSLSHNTIFTILEHTDGTLWVATMGGGLDRFDPVTETFTHYRHYPEEPGGLRDNQVHGLWLDADGVLWVGTHAGGLHRFDPAMEVFEVYQYDPDDLGSLSHNDVNTIYQDGAGTFWIGTAGGLNRFNPETGRFAAYRHDPNDPGSLSHDNVMRILEDENGVLWVGVGGNDVRGGLHRFDPETGTFIRYQYDPDDPGSLGSNYVLSLYEDRHGALWVGTWGGGVSKHDPAAEKFAHFARTPGEPNSLSTNQVLAFHEDRNGMLWIGTWGGGLDRFDPATNTFTNYRHDPTNPNSLAGDEVMAIYEDRDGMLWLGTWSGLDLFDPATEQFTHFRSDLDATGNLDYNEVTSIYEDRRGALWLGTWMAGLNRFDRTTNTFTHFVHDPADSTSLSANHVGTIFEDDGGTLWIATGDGQLNRFDPETEQFEAQAPMGGRMALRTFTPSVAMPGRYWLGTTLRGLHLYDPETDTSEAFTEADGLPHDGVLGLLEDDEGFVWVSTARGLSKFDYKERRFRTYEITEALQGNKLMYTAAYKSRSGALYFGGSQGFISFYPGAVTDNPHVPPVVLTDFKLFTESVAVGEDSPLKAHISVAEEIRLAHWQNDISFGFAALNYQASEKNTYAFKLQNYDEEWRYAGTGRTATYTNLAPGEYVFRVTGSNNDDVWNDQGASIRVIISPPWWQTPWAYILFVIFGVAGVFGVVRWRVRYLERRAHDLEVVVSARTAEVVRQKATIEAQAQKLQELDRLKSRFFANISHEFRTPLLLILGPLQDMLDGAFGTVGEAMRKQVATMQRSGFRLLRLINQLLDLSKLESGNMRLAARRANLMPFLRGIVLSFSSMAERKHITFDLHAELDRVDLAFDPDKLEKVFYNLLSNAFKFTPEHGAIRVLVKDEAEGYVEIHVSDTGRGIPPAALPYIFDRFRQVDSSMRQGDEGTGIGLALVRELVALHSGTISAESSLGKGTTFIVRLPRGGANAIPAAPMEQAHGDGLAAGPYREIALQALPQVIPTGDGAPAPLAPVLPDNAPTILLVEDNPDVRAYVSSHLAPHYRLDEATNGQEALEKVRRQPPDLVISDVMMPVMDGYALCRAIKQDEALNHIPLILLTAKAGQESKVEGLETGADDYIYKPFSADELLARAENLIEIRRILRQRFSREVVAVEPSAIAMASADQAFLEQVQAIVEAHMAHGNFNAAWLADEVGLSPRQLRRKLKDLTNLSTAGYIRLMRLKRAAHLLKEQTGNVSEVAYAVGFQDPKHFSKLFRQVFGMPPSQAHLADDM